MKTCKWLMLALGAVILNAALPAEEIEKADASAIESRALSTDEQAFAAKLNDLNRKTFANKFSAEQRRATMIAVKNGTDADEAVQRMLASREIKSQIVTASEDHNADLDEEAN